MLKIILIGGVPGTGKTTLSYQLAQHFGIDKIISLDLLKIFSQKFYSKYEKPYLYTTTIESYLEDDFAKSALLNHCKTIQDELFSILPLLESEKVIIVEGAQITPNILDRFNNTEVEVFYIHLCAEKETLLQRYIKKEKMRFYEWRKNIFNILKIQEFLIDSVYFKEYYESIFSINIEKENFYNEVLNNITLFLEGN